jgi:trimeric autotransporter adhesin
MIRNLRWAVCGIVFLFAFSTLMSSQQYPSAGGSVTTSATSQLPRLVKFSGSLTSFEGSPLSGIVGVTFALYCDQSGGAPLWLETQNVQADKNGRYNVVLGSTQAEGLPSDLFASNEARWLGVQLQGQAEQPRVMFLSVPYALKAVDAETLGGKPASAYALATPQTGTSAPVNESPKPNAAIGTSNKNQSSIQASIAGGGTTNYIPLWTSSTALGNSSIFENATNKHIGIGTTTPAAALDVKGSVNASTSFNLGGQAFAFGSYSLQNAFLGFSGNSAVTGSFNTASGYHALYQNTTGVSNTASGWSALYSNTTGASNTALGQSALFSNTTGNYNTALGQGALHLNTTGTHNTASGYNALLQNGTGNDNTASGFETLIANTTGSANTASGVYALNSNTTGGENTASGAEALYSNTTGGLNTANGFDALRSNNTGGSNTATGYDALYQNTTGNYNTASGSQALYANNTGGSNTADGYLALYNNTTGGSNTASGYQALWGNTTGGGNTAFGQSALTFNSTGSGNTALGYGAGTKQANLSNATAIGYDAQVSESNAMVLGSIEGLQGAAASTNVGIGTTTPVATLDINGNNGTGGLDTYIGNACGGYGAGIGFGSAGFNSCTNYSVLGDGASTYINSPSSNIFFRVANTTLMEVDANGNVGIGAKPDNLLTVNGSADKPGGGSWGTYSDGRLKTLRGNFQSGLNQVLKLHPVRYRYKPDNAMGIRDMDEHIGLVAQDVQRVIPEAVTENSKGYLLVNNDPIIWSMLNAIKEQQREIRDLKSELRATRQTLQKVKAQVAAAQPALVAAK